MNDLLYLITNQIYTNWKSMQDNDKKKKPWYIRHKNRKIVHKFFSFQLKTLKLSTNSQHLSSLKFIKSENV